MLAAGVAAEMGDDLFRFAMARCSQAEAAARVGVRGRAAGWKAQHRSCRDVCVQMHVSRCAGHIIAMR